MGAAIFRFWRRDVVHPMSPRSRSLCYGSGSIRPVDTSPLAHPSGGIGGRDHGPATRLHAPSRHGGCQRIWCDDSPRDTRLTLAPSSSLIDGVTTVCRRLAPEGWRDLLLAVSHDELDITTADLSTMLSQPLSQIDRTIPGFEDFALEGTRALNPAALLAVCSSTPWPRRTSSETRQVTISQRFRPQPRSRPLKTTSTV